MNGAQFITATAVIDGVRTNPFAINADGLSTSRALVKQVKTLFDVSGARCRIIQGIGPDGCMYIILKPRGRSFGSLDEEVYILIEEKLTEDSYKG